MPARLPSTRVHPVLGLACLLVYLCFATPITPAATALAAWFDGEHNVSVAMERTGTRVVLSHDASDPRKSVTHSHCLVSRTILSIGNQVEPFHADHILSFDNIDSTAAGSTAARIIAPSVNQPAPAIVLNAQDSREIAPAYAFSPTLGPPPPSLSVVICRVTVLLI